MTVELISVGTEILLGNIVNTNAAYLAEKIAILGLSCYHQSAVGDNEERLEDAIRLALSRSDIVILSGGALRGCPYKRADPVLFRSDRTEKGDHAQQLETGSRAGGGDCGR